MTFEAEVGTVKTRCLLDTGSSINVLSKSCFDRIPNRPHLTPTATVAKTASQSAFPLMGRVVLDFVVGKHCIPVPFFVSELLDIPVLLGLEFLQVCPCVVDLKKRCLVVTPQESVHSLTVETVTVGSVMNPKDVSVPPGAELSIQCKVPKCSYRGPALVEPVWVQEGLHLVPALVEVTEDNTVPVVVRNLSIDYLTVPKRAELAQLEVGYVEQATEEESSPGSFSLEDQIDLTGAKVSASERARLLKLLKQFSPVLDGRLGHTEVVTHTIDTRSTSPIRQTSRRIPPHLRAEVKEELERMLELGVIEESEGFWGSPICLVRRRNGKLRVCADYRALNSKTQLQAYYMPRVDDTLEALSGSSLFIVLDFNSAYYQVSVDPKDRDKTTIVTPFGTFRHVRMPFGLKGACCTCARLLDKVLDGLTPHVALSYFDDVIIHGNTFDELLTKLEQVLERLRDANLTLNLSKCKWVQPSVTFLGHVVSAEGLRADPEKIQKVREWPVPRSAKELASFLGLATYFKRYVKDYAGIASPLFRLTNKDVTYEWSREAQAAFDALKEALCSAPVLSLPQYDSDAGEFVLEVDASGKGIGAVLLQRQGDDERVIAYGSKQLSKAESNYSVCKRELLSVVYFIRHFHAYLAGKPFLLRTDHASLQWLISFKNPTGMLARWLETLGQYSFRVEHQRGRDHLAADALSRMPSATAEACTQTEGSEPVRLLRSQDWSLSFIRSEQEADPGISEITQHLSRGVKPHKRQLGAGLPYLAEWSKLRLLDGVLFRVYRRRPKDEDQLQVVVPESLVDGVLLSMHSGPTGGHFASDKLLAQLRVRFWWPKMVPSVSQYCARCERCSEHSPPIPAPRASLGELAASEPFEVVGIDILCGLPRTPDGNKHLLVIVDHFSRWCEAYPLKDMTAASVAEVFVKEFVSRYGVPSRLHSDQGGCFMSELLAKTCKLLGVARSTISSYHPMGNSVVERMNRTILSMLAKYLESNAHATWDRHLPLLMLGYRSQIHRSLRYSPYEVLFGRRARLPADVALNAPKPSQNRSVEEYLDELRESLKAIHHDALAASHRSHSRNQSYYEQKLNEFKYQPGQVVRLHRAAVPRGEYYKFTRPYKKAKILAQVGPLNYRVRVTGKSRPVIVHHNRLSPCASVDVSEGEVGPAIRGQRRESEPMNRGHRHESVGEPAPDMSPTPRPANIPPQPDRLVDPDLVLCPEPSSSRGGEVSRPVSDQGTAGGWIGQGSQLSSDESDEVQRFGDPSPTGPVQDPGTSSEDDGEELETPPEDSREETETPSEDDREGPGTGDGNEGPDLETSVSEGGQDLGTPAPEGASGGPEGASGGPDLESPSPVPESPVRPRYRLPTPSPLPRKGARVRKAKHRYSPS